MPWNDKSLRLRWLRDRLHLNGDNRPSFELSVNLLLETIGLVKSRRNLSYVKRDVAKLRDRTPDPTIEQLEKLELLDQRLARKFEMADNRKQRSAETRAKQPAKPPATVAPPPSEDIW